MVIPICSLRIVCALPHLIDFILYTKRFSNYKSAKISTKSKGTRRGTRIKCAFLRVPADDRMYHLHDTIFITYNTDSVLHKPLVIKNFEVFSIK